MRLAVSRGGRLAQGLDKKTCASQDILDDTVFEELLDAVFSGQFANVHGGMACETFSRRFSATRLLLDSECLHSITPSGIR